MPHTRNIETTFAIYLLIAGFATNFAGFMLIGQLIWPLSIAFNVLGTSSLIGAMVLVAAADRNHGEFAPSAQN